MNDITEILSRCEALWRRQSMGENTIFEMRSEIESHLHEAQAAGKHPNAVVGSSVDDFARQWAKASRPNSLPASMLAASPRNLEAAEKARRTKARLTIALVAIAVITIAGLVLGGEATAADNIETWQWIFVGATFTLLIGEMLSGGFFVLPFAVGAASAALLAFAEVAPTGQLIVFTLVSIFALWGLREFAQKDDDEVVAVGANRYVDRQAVVTEGINGIASIGRVRLDTESWLAVTDNNEWIEPGTVVRVLEVRGARFVVSAG